MNTSIEILLAEETELNEKRAKLNRFIESEEFKNIDASQRSLLKIQSCSMSTYAECLNQYIIDITTNKQKATA